MKRFYLRRIYIGFISVFVFFILPVVSGGCSFDDKPMLSFPKGSSYNDVWEKVTKLEKKGLPKSVLQLVDSIYLRAKKDTNYAQIVKSIIYRQKFKMQVEEDAVKKSLLELKAEADSAKFPLQPVLYSMLAESYWLYYQQNRWQFLNRTYTQSYIPEDISTWDLTRIVNNSRMYYKKSLESKDSLQRTLVNLYDDVLQVYPESRELRPTLYDFLVHRAIDFYINSEADVAVSANGFLVDDEEYFSGPEEFISNDLDKEDTISLKLEALRTFQELISFHQENDSITQMADANLKRLKFVYNQSVIQDKDSVYLNALDKFIEEYPKLSFSKEYLYAKAEVYYTQASQYVPEFNTRYKDYYQKAKDICNEILLTKSCKHAELNAKYLISQIEAPSMSFSIEAFNLPNQKILTQINYRNLDQISIRIAKIDRQKHKNDLEKLDYDEIADFYADIDFIKQIEVNIPKTEDHQNHSIEIAIPELETGYYVLIASDNKEFRTDSSAFAYAYTSVTDIAYVQRKNSKEEYEYYVFSRSTGKPLANVIASIWKEHYNYILQKYVYTKSGSKSTNNEGYFKIKAPYDYRSFYLDFKYGDDELYTDESFYQSRPYNSNYKYWSVHIFTDRAIYRPGQTVYFKGLLLDPSGENPKIVKNQNVYVYFYDVNYQNQGDLCLKTNDYGTFNGSFVIPEGILTGRMQIQTSYGTVYFNVEEYKRPKFEVKINAPDKAFRLNEKVKLEGKAESYAGSVIDGAEVKYKVTRSTYYPFHFYYWRWFNPPTSQQTVISHGSTVTDDNGSFFIEFEAIPDLNVLQKWNPAFTYTITADVTDINGETRSATDYINIGYKSMILSTELSEKTNISELHSITIEAKNLKGKSIEAKGSFEILKLKSRDKIEYPRKWQAPDLKYMSEKEFEEAFPNMNYDGVLYMSDLDIEKRIRKGSFVSGKEIGLDDNEWAEGIYKLVAESEDIFGETIRMESYFVLYDTATQVLPEKLPFWTAPVKISGEPGEKASLLIGSGEKELHVMVETEHKGKIVNKTSLILSKEKQLLEFPILEKHRGNFTIHITAIKNNHVYTSSQLIEVPYSNKELDISFETFRNKLLPGQDEEWRIKILGPNGEKVAAEMMATLYDASLDAFVSNDWYLSLYKTFYGELNWTGNQNFSYNNSSLLNNNWYTYLYYIPTYYDALNWFGFYYPYYNNYYLDDLRTITVSGCAMEDEESIMDGFVCNQSTAAYKVTEKKEASASEDKDASGEKLNRKFETVSKEQAYKNGGESTEGQGTPVKARSDFRETAFFMPELRTDEEGNIVIKFTIPEALTTWKMLGFAHTKDLKYGFIENELITQKNLMVIPNLPRFLRENDKIVLSAKISNISGKDLNGVARIEFFDAATLKAINDKFKIANSGSKFAVKAKSSTAVSWEVEVPEGISAVTCRISAKSGDFSDGEESLLPVLTNRMLVTESMPLPVNGHQTKEFKFEKLLNSSASKTLKHHSYTLEFTPNPAWYAVQALPYLIEYPYECAEQVYSRFYANSLATHIANSDPSIKKVFDAWKNTKSSQPLLSNLEKNQELKSLILEETPWVLEAKDESERKRRIGLLFDLKHMAANLRSAKNKLEKLQSANGGWVWFKGMPEDRYMSQHIVAGFGHLNKLGVTEVDNDWKIRSMTQKGVSYLDREILKDYKYLKKHYTKEELKEKHISYIQIHYLYARSFFLDKYTVSSSLKEAYNYYLGQTEDYWLDESLYMKAMIALALQRNGKTDDAEKIMKSIKEHSLQDEEMGVYWKDNTSGYYWYQAPVETQALLIEAYEEIGAEKEFIDQMRIWLLKQKQTQDWKTTKATAEAIYALLLSGTNWLVTESGVDVYVDNQLMDPKAMGNVDQEAGTGYFKVVWRDDEVKPSMGTIKLVKKDDGISWGAVYWQYFEQLDKITPHDTPLKLSKKLFIEKVTDHGVQMIPLESDVLEVGDKVIVRIELRTDRDMEYVHLKDMRASSFEPLNVLSGYKYQDGLGYYESTRDAATNFFIQYLKKGTYVFEYPLRVAHEGDFSNGITSVQSMYAPEFGAHSEGIRINVE